MENIQTLSNQNPTGAEVQPPKMSSNSKLFLIVVISVLLTGIITGSAVYFWQKSVNKKATSGLNQQVSSLEDQISMMEKIEKESKGTSLPRISPTSTTNTTVNLKTYVNEKFGFSIQHPEFIIVEEKDQGDYLTVFFRLRSLGNDMLVCDGTHLAINVNNDGLCGSLAYKGTTSEIIESEYLVDKIPTTRYDDYFQNKHVETRLGEIFKDNYYLIDYIITPGDYPQLEENHKLFNQMLSSIKFIN